MNWPQAWAQLIDWRSSAGPAAGLAAGFPATGGVSSFGANRISSASHSSWSLSSTPGFRATGRTTRTQFASGVADGGSRSKRARSPSGRTS